jgi:hypothetical protein
MRVLTSSRLSFTNNFQKPLGGVAAILTVALAPPS